MELAQSHVADCRVSVLQSMGNTPIDTTTEAGRMHSIILSMVNKSTISQCDEIVAKVTDEYNATDRARITAQTGMVRIGGMIVGGYVIGEAIAGLAAAGGTRVKINGNKVASKGSGGSGEEQTGASTGITGGSIYNVNVDSTVQQATGGASSLAAPNLEYAQDLGTTSPQISEGASYAPSQPVDDRDTVGLGDLL